MKELQASQGERRSHRNAIPPPNHEAMPRQSLHFQQESDRLALKGRMGNVHPKEL